MKNLGYIYLHRRLKEKAFYKKPEYVLLWIHLLLSANHKESEIIWDNQVIKLKAGQLITGRKSLSEQTGVNEYKVERILKFFKSAQQIAQQTFPKFRIITIQKWENYQCNGSKVHNKVHNRCTTDAQQMHTNNNDNNDKNEEKSSSFKKEKRFYKPTNEEMRFSKNKWWVIPKVGGEWLEFSGNLIKDTYLK